MFIVCLLVSLLLIGSLPANAGTTVIKAPPVFSGLSLEAGLVLDWSPYPYDAAIYRQEIVSYHGLKTMHQFSPDADKTMCAAAWETALGYEVADFCFSLGFTTLASRTINIYSYYWADPNLPCVNEGIDTGCELAFIRLDGFLLYRVGIEYHLWDGFYVKWQGGRGTFELLQGRETYGTEDPEAVKSLYQENVWTNDLMLRWTTSDPQSGLRFLIEAGWGKAQGKLAAGNRFFFGLKLNGRLWQF